MPLERRGNPRAHPVDQRQECLRQKIERRRPRLCVPPSSTISDGRRRSGGRAARSAAPASALPAVPTLNCTCPLAPAAARIGATASQSGPLHHSATDLRRGLHRGQMLPQQTRLLPPCANVLNRHRPAGDQRKRQRRAEDLSAAFALEPSMDGDDWLSCGPSSIVRLIAILDHKPRLQPRHFAWPGRPSLTRAQHFVEILVGRRGFVLRVVAAVGQDVVLRRTTGRSSAWSSWRIAALRPSMRPAPWLTL